MTEVDVIIVGSGAGGLTTAIVAAQAGLSVMLLEKTQYFGGTTAYSGGAIWIPDNHLMKAIGLDDSLEEAEEYLRAVLGNLYDGEKIETFLANGPKMLSYMEANSRACFKAGPLPDYKPGQPGAKRGRTLITPAFDNRELGEYAAQLRPQRAELTLFGDMQLEGGDIHQFRKVYKNFASFRHTTRLMVKYVADKIRYGRSTRIVNGNALAGRLLKSAIDHKVQLVRNAEVTSLVRDGSRITGVTVKGIAGVQSVSARKGVVLATGGYGANKAMRERFMPMAQHHSSLQPDANVGDGINMGVAVGGSLVEDNQANGIWAPTSVLRHKDGTQSVLPHIFLDRYMPGQIVVNPQGKRFVSEADSYQHFVDTMHRLNLSKVHMIADADFVRTYGMGLARPFPFPVGKYVRNGYLLRANTISELGEKIGVDPTMLEATVARFNGFARLGVDPDFGRGADLLTQYRGDPDNRPNPSLAPIVKGPFYALALLPGDLSSVNGLQTDAEARVLDTDRLPIPGLYAVGLDMNSMTRGMYPGGGVSIGPAMTFGYIVGRSLANA